MQRQCELEAAGDFVLKAESAGSEKDEHRPFNRCQRAGGACGGRSYIADPSHGVPRAFQAREHLPGRAASPGKSEDWSTAYVLQSDCCLNRAAVFQRSKPPEHPDQAGIGTRYSTWFHSPPCMAASCGRLLADRAASSGAFITSCCFRVCVQ